jgi:hypothetical protein
MLDDRWKMEGKKRKQGDMEDGKRNNAKCKMKSAKCKMEKINE